MKRILLIFGMLVLGLTSMNAQRDWDEYVRRFEIAIVSNPLETVDTPNKYWGSWMVIDTSNDNKVSLWNETDGTWVSEITLDSINLGALPTSLYGINDLTDGYWDDTYDNLGLGLTTLGDSVASPGDMSEIIAIGKDAWFNAEAPWYGIAIGDGAFYNNIDGYYDHAIGYEVAYNYTGGGNNVIFGHQAFYSPITGTGNTVMGSNAFYGSESGDNDYNTIIGNSAGTGLKPTSDGNVLIGNDVAGTLDTGSYNVIIGEDVEPTQADTSYYFAIGANGNTVIAGDIDDNYLDFPGGQVNRIRDIAAASGSVGLGDYFVTVSYTDTGTASIDLESAIAAIPGYTVIIFDKELNASGNNITITTEGSETINEAATATISTNGGKLTFITDGTNWLSY